MAPVIPVSCDDWNIEVNGQSILSSPGTWSRYVRDLQVVKCQKRSDVSVVEHFGVNQHQASVPFTDLIIVQSAGRNLLLVKPEDGSTLRSFTFNSEISSFIMSGNKMIVITINNHEYSLHVIEQYDKFIEKGVPGSGIMRNVTSLFQDKFMAPMGIPYLITAGYWLNLQSVDMLAFSKPQVQGIPQDLFIYSEVSEGIYRIPGTLLSARRAINRTKLGEYVMLDAYDPASEHWDTSKPEFEEIIDPEFLLGSIRLKSLISTPSDLSSFDSILLDGSKVIMNVHSLTVSVS